MDPYVNSIEKYLVNTNKTGKIIDDVLSFGYGLKDISTFSSTIIAHFYQGKLADEAHTAQFYPPNNNIYYRIKPFALQGMAGSPVFLTYHMPNDSREGVIFGGVLFGTDAEHNSAYVVNGDLVKAQVANFKN